MTKEIDISKIFKENRRRLGLTQNQMADLINIKRGRYGSYEEGRACPKISELVNITRLLGYDTIDAFLKLKEPVWTSGKMNQAYRHLNDVKKKIVDYILNLDR
ncbi:MAG: helix-turn-helix transcriptional regulator [Chitinophagaceae bacterium]